VVLTTFGISHCLSFPDHPPPFMPALPIPPGFTYCPPFSPSPSIFKVCKGSPSPTPPPPLHIPPVVTLSNPPTLCHMQPHFLLFVSPFFSFARIMHTLPPGVSGLFYSILLCFLLFLRFTPPGVPSLFLPPSRAGLFLITVSLLLKKPPLVFTNLTRKYFFLTNRTRPATFLFFFFFILF